MLRKRSWIDEANECINIADLLTNIGVFVPDTIRNGGNKKVHCPFGFYHSDGGTSKAMRIYVQSNTAYCFSCAKRYSPVSLASAYWDCAHIPAALRLLEEAGIKAKSIEERWVVATTPAENKPDLIALAESLKVYCSRVVDNWNSLQYEDYVANKLTKCLTLLDLVKTDQDAEKWLTSCKIIMSNVLEAQ